MQCLIHSLIRHLLGAYYVPGTGIDTVVDTSDTQDGKSPGNLFSRGRDSAVNIESQYSGAPG